MNPRADPPVGHPDARVTTTTRRGTPWQDQSPSFLWPPASAGTAAFSQGHPPAHPRHAISTREHQTGGAPTRSAPTRRGYPYPRPPPTQPGDRLTRRVKTVRPRADALRALRLDPTGRRRLPRTGRGAAHTTDKPVPNYPSYLTVPFHIRKPLLYPLSYEGAGPQRTCQQVSTRAGECRRVPTRSTSPVRRAGEHTTSTRPRVTDTDAVQWRRVARTTNG